MEIEVIKKLSNTILDSEKIKILLDYIEHLSEENRQLTDSIDKIYE